MNKDLFDHKLQVRYLEYKIGCNQNFLFWVQVFMTLIEVPGLYRHAIKCRTGIFVMASKTSDKNDKPEAAKHTHDDGSSPSRTETTVTTESR
jgi:hypothetical protein